ncbi:MAG: hypothetical protein QW404_00385 [Candidatus Nanoarchaeia archaeon]
MKKYMVFIYSGMISSLMDLDHAITLIREGIPINPTNLMEHGSRMLHFPTLYALATYAIITIIMFVINIGNSTKNYY